jgi:Cu/Ag efflux pump CusA
VLDASVEVRGAVVYATLAVLLVFLPILTLSGVTGRIFAPLGEAYILAVLASLLVALTVTPALCLWLLPRASGKEPPLVTFLGRRYTNLLRRVERHPRLVLATVVVLLVAGAATVPFLRTAFLPPMREGQLIVHMTAMPGTCLLYTSDAADE